jgi:hypothetical protein
MPWIHKSPFGRDEDPARYMVSLLSQEAVRSGIPLSEAEERILASEYVPSQPIDEDLHERTKRLIAQTLQRERETPAGEDTKSFRSSIGWAGDQNYPNIVAVAEEVITGGGLGRIPPLRGRAWLKDRTKLIGCAFVAVLVMFLVVAVVTFFFSRK